MSTPANNLNQSEEKQTNTLIPTMRILTAATSDTRPAVFSMGTMKRRDRRCRWKISDCSSSKDTFPTLPCRHLNYEEEIDLYEDNQPKSRNDAGLRPDGKDIPARNPRTDANGKKIQIRGKTTRRSSPMYLRSSLSSYSSDLETISEDDWLIEDTADIKSQSTKENQKQIFSNLIFRGIRSGSPPNVVAAKLA